MAGGGHPSKVVQITNIAPQATKDQMQNLFGNIGKIDEIRLYPSIRDVSCPVYSRICYVKFFESSCVAVAQHMTNTVFIDRALIVCAVPSGYIPDEYTALEITKNGTTVPGLLTTDSNLPPDVINRIDGVHPHQYVTTSDPKLEAFDLPPYPQLPANYDARKIEEIRRTLVVLDVLPQWKMDDVMEHFTRLSGQVKYARLAETTSSRCFLLEFSEQKSIAAALRLQGTEYNHGILNIYHSAVAIIKPEAKSNEAAQREIEEAMNIVKEAQSMLNAAMHQNSGSGGAVDSSPNDKDKNSSSRRRSRSRSRSRRRSVSRSRSKRSRSRKRSRSKHRSSRRSRSRSKKRSSSRSKRSSPSRKRSRSRKRSKSRSKRSKSVSRRDDRSKRSSRSPSSRSKRSRSKDRRKRSRSAQKRRSHSRSPAPSSRRRATRSKSRDRKHRSKSRDAKHRRHNKDDKHRRSRSKSKDRHRDKEAKESKRASSRSKESSSRSSKRKSPAADTKRLPRVSEEKVVARDYDEEEKIGSTLPDDSPKKATPPKGAEAPPAEKLPFKPPEPVEQRSPSESPEKSDHMDISNSP